MWEQKKQYVYELTPTTIKKYIAGNGKATKEKVAQSLSLYVGNQTYNTDDESDAVAAGVAWLVQEGFVDQIVQDQKTKK